MARSSEQYSMKTALARGVPPIARTDHPGDGTSVAKPVHGVGEWAKHSVNIQSGCEHDCRYCYGKCLAVRFGRKTAATWKEPSIDPAKVAHGYRRLNGRVMFPTSHDITPANLVACLFVLRRLLNAGNELLVVSKPHLFCIEAITRQMAAFAGQMMFRFTIGSLSNSVLQFWEPGAPAAEERLDALRLTHAAGFRTSISGEPMLDTQTDALVEAVRPFVTDSIWLGRANRLRQTLSINCPNDAEARLRANQLLSEHSDEYIRGIYQLYKDDPRIRFKDSIKKVVGLQRPQESGLDI